jgi:hypothetical protein
MMSATPAAADTPSAPFWAPAAGVVPVAGNSFAITDDPAHTTVADGVVVQTDTTTDFTVGTASDGTTEFQFRDTSWTFLRLGTADRGRLQVGTYEDTHWRSGSAQLRYTADGHSCGEPIGRLQIRRADYAGSTLERLDASFEQRCPGTTTHGELHWDAQAEIPPAPNPGPIPDGLWEPPAGATPESGNYTYVSGYLPPVIPGSGDLLLPGGVSWGLEAPDAPPSSRLSFYGLDGDNAIVTGTLIGPTREGGLRVGLYDDLDGWQNANPVVGGLATTVHGYTCPGTIDSWFAIDELTRVGREITHITFRFERTCDHWNDGGDHYDVVRGKVNWNAAPTITGIFPDHGPRRGGTTITFNGTDLNGITSATIGGVPATVQYDMFDQLQVVTPPLPLGRYEVVLHAAGGTATFGGSSGFTVEPNHALAPTAITMAGGPASATVSWTPPEDLGDVTITGIEVDLWSPSIDDQYYPEAKVVVGPDDLVALVPQLVPGQGYAATVTYLDGTGSGARSLRSAPVGIPLPDVVPFDGVPTLVTQQYIDFTGRAPTTEERSAAVADIRAGKKLPEAYVAAMRNRPEWGRVRAPITRLYSAYFGRLPDGTGLAYWSKKLRSGTSLSRVSATFAASSEFQRRYGRLSHGAFVDLIYRNVLHRSADSGGRTFWIGKLNAGVDRGSVMVDFSESPEHIRSMASTVDAVLLYTGMLRRMPTTTELPASADERASADGTRAGTADATDPVVLAEQLRRSPAYAARF